MKKLVLIALFSVISAAFSFSQNQYNYTKKMMNGEFSTVVTHVNSKAIYAIDLEKIISEDSRVNFMEMIHRSDKVFPISTPDKDNMLFIAGFESVISEADVKALLLTLKANSESSSAPSPENKSKFSTK